MFELYHRDKQLFPIKVWLRKPEELDGGCLEQARNLANLPFLHKWVAVMPDAHQGIGMPIGGVIALENAVIPNAVGVDIGCGMAFLQTNIPAELLRKVQTANGSLIQTIVGDIMRDIPVGFAHQRQKQPSRVLDEARRESGRYAAAPELLPELEAGYEQVGTLGGGNHFIEIQKDEAGMAAIMLHSGSRNFGFKICNYFNRIAKKTMKKSGLKAPPEFNLACLPVESVEGASYIVWMNLALAFARENRERMLERVAAIVERLVTPHLKEAIVFNGEVNCHHNYAAYEEHYGRKVWVHRKGAIKATAGEIGIIPGAMGTASFIVNGLGNPESFHSSSHGAGRKFSRTSAKERFSVDEVLKDLKEREVVLGKHKKSDVAEESRHAYKDVEWVLQNERDLVEPVKRLQTIGVVKG
jgi:tRNA-splicing ligase RtcB